MRSRTIWGLLVAKKAEGESPRYIHHILSDKGRFVVAMLGALTRIEQHLFPKLKRTDVLLWRARMETWKLKYQNTYPTLMDNDSYWSTYLDLNYAPKPKQLRNNMPAYDLFGQFIFDYAKGSYKLPDSRKLDQNSLNAHKDILSKFADTIESIVLNKRKRDASNPKIKSRKLDDPIEGAEVLDALFLKVNGGTNFNSISDLFPKLKNEYLSDTPGVKLLSGPSLEMALFDYAPNSDSPKCGIFVVIREARPPEVSANKIGLVRDLIYIHKPFGPPTRENKDVSDGSYISSVDQEMYPIKVTDHDNYIKIIGLSTDDDKKNVQLYFGHPDLWEITSEQNADKYACTVGLLHGITEVRKSPGSWKVLVSKPEKWGADLAKIRAMLDLCGAETPNLIPTNIRKQIVEKLDRTGLRVIGKYPRPQNETRDDDYTTTRKLFSDYVSFLSDDSRSKRMRNVAKQLGFDEGNTRKTINYEDFKASFNDNWFDIEPSLFVLNLEGDRPIRKLEAKHFKDLFGRKRLPSLQKK